MENLNLNLAGIRLTVAREYEIPDAKKIDDGTLIHGKKPFKIKDFTGFDDKSNIVRNTR